MRRLRPVAVWTLLATLIAGGLLGPTLHRLHHAQERSAMRAEGPCHAPAVHNSDVPLWTAAGGHIETLSCDLCATRLIVVPPSLDLPPSPRRAGTTQVTLRTHLAPAPVVPDRLIRGPPARDRARLA